METFDFADLELRILAMEAKKGFDIHRKKAAEIFGVPESEVTPEQRRIGKLENYRKIYGTNTGRITSYVPPFHELSRSK